MDQVRRSVHAICEVHRSLMQFCLVLDPRSKPKLSIIETFLYNIAAMLAGVACGYDVRLSNVTPIHPRLRPDRYVWDPHSFNVACINLVLFSGMMKNLTNESGGLGRLIPHLAPLPQIGIRF